MRHYVVRTVVVQRLGRPLGRFGPIRLVVAPGQLLLRCVCAAYKRLDRLVQQGVCSNGLGDSEAIWYVVSTEGGSDHAIALRWLCGPRVHVCGRPPCRGGCKVHLCMADNHILFTSALSVDHSSEDGTPCAATPVTAAQPTCMWLHALSSRALLVNFKVDSAWILLGP